MTAAPLEGFIITANGPRLPSKPVSFSTEISIGTDAGTYYVWYASDGRDMAKDSMPESLTVTIDHDWEWVTDSDADCGKDSCFLFFSFP